MVLVRSGKPAKRALKVVAKKPAAASRPAVRALRPRVSWRADYALIEALRAQRDAPVDTIGCDRLADKRASKADFEWQCLVSAMLSSQTRDQANAQAMAALRVHGNSAKSIASTPERKLEKL